MVPSKYTVVHTTTNIKHQCGKYHRDKYILNARVILLNVAFCIILRPSIGVTRASNESSYCLDDGNRFNQFQDKFLQWKKNVYGRKIQPI